VDLAEGSGPAFLPFIRIHVGLYDGTYVGSGNLDGHVPIDTQERDQTFTQKDSRYDMSEVRRTCQEVGNRLCAKDGW
jgi:hypothetical protein